MFARRAATRALRTVKVARGMSSVAITDQAPLVVPTIKAALDSLVDSGVNINETSSQNLARLNKSLYVTRIEAQEKVEVSKEKLQEASKVAPGHALAYEGARIPEDTLPLIKANENETLTSTNPTTGEILAQFTPMTSESALHVLQRCVGPIKTAWSTMPMPQRGEALRQMGDLLTTKKSELARIISKEMGKIFQEALGEVQEAIDICYFAAGLSRNIGGSVMNSERPDHFMMERWHPLDKSVLVISAFNFPFAVFFWNYALATLGGNTVVFKPSETTTLTGLAASNIVSTSLSSQGLPVNLFCFPGGRQLGNDLIHPEFTSLVSFTGSTAAGRKVGARAASLFIRSLLELGGNNAGFVMADANLKLARDSIVFSAAGTAGQRCTSLRRLYVDADVYDQLKPMLVGAYEKLVIGDPLDAKTHIGPIHSEAQIKLYEDTIATLKKDSTCTILHGGSAPKGKFVQPTIVEVPANHPLLKEERFIPVLYLVKVPSLTFFKAKTLNNAVDHGLSSCLYTESLTSAMEWVSGEGSDCGIANVNIGPSGAEIGGAFGGEKHTGGGRESGSDAWKNYMRRQTVTINYSGKTKLAQGINFDVTDKTNAADNQ